MIRRAGFGLVAGALALAIMGAPPAQAANEWEKRGPDITGALTSEFGYSVDVSADGNTWIAGGPKADPDGNFNAGTARVFTWNGESWEQRGSTITGTNTEDYLGEAVAISDDGNTIAVGVPHTVNTGNRPGRVRIYTWDGSDWQQLGSDIVGEEDGDEFGAALALSADGRTVAAGAPFYDGIQGANAGLVRVLEWNGSWTILGIDTEGGTAGDQFGTSVALSADGQTMAGGAPRNNNPGSDSGNARVYSYTGGVWVKDGQSISGEAPGDRSGRSVALSGDGRRVAIGAPENDGNGSSSGQVRVYEYDIDSDLWIQLGGDIDGSAAGDDFGLSVDLSNDGNTLLVGIQLSGIPGDQAGSAEVFSWNGTSWNQRGQTLNGNEAGERFGWSVAISSDGDKFVVGGKFANVPGNNSGVVRAYTWIPASGAISGPRTEFTYWLPDGRECTSISPEPVQVGTFHELPGENALCQTSDGSLVAGWLISVPEGFTGAGSSSLPLQPGHKVLVIESQQFTVVPFAPVVTVEYDANIGADASCEPADAADPSDNPRIGYSWVPRVDFAMARAWDQAPCTPEGYELVGWNTAGDGSGESIELGAPLPADWEASRVNERRLFAMWQAL